MAPHRAICDDIRTLKTETKANGLTLTLMGVPRKWWMVRVHSCWDMIGGGCGPRGVRHTSLKAAVRAAEAIAAELEAANPKWPGRAICGTPFIMDFMAQHGRQPTDEELGEFIRQKVGE